MCVTGSVHVQYVRATVGLLTARSAPPQPQLSDILYVALNWLQYYITSFTCVFVYIFCNIGIPVTNCEGERSFSTLSRVKYHLRSTMGQTRLSSLSLLCIESGLLQYLDTNSIIDKFSMKKSRKKLFWNRHSLLYFMCYQHWLCFKLIVFLSLLPYIRCRWYKSNDVLHCVEIRISYIIILWYYVVFVDIWPFQKITVKKKYIYWILSETCQHFYKFGCPLTSLA